MSRNTLLAVVSLLVVIVLGSAGSYWAYKKMKKQRDQEYRCECKIPYKEGFDAEVFRASILAEDTVSRMINELQLVSVWGLADDAAAKMKIDQEFQIQVVEDEIEITYTDKNKVTAAKILKYLIADYQERSNAARGKPAT